MKVKKYVVLWHEDNDSGIPKHVMGSSKPLDARVDAEKWIIDSINEDRDRSMERDHTPLEVCEDAGDGVWSTYGCGQHTYYKIEEIEWEDLAADAVAGVKKFLKPTFVNGKEVDCGERIRQALVFIDERERNWLPLREWAVDIHFCPAACVHHVMARTGEEAQQMVDDMLDNRTLKLTEEQKAEMMDCLLENVESTELVGPEEAQ